MVWRVLLVIAVAVAAPTAAVANGRYPAAMSVHFRPGSASEIVIGATWGMLKTTDGGATWRWVCEEAIGYGGEYDPDYAVTPSGVLLATTLGGLRTTTDGCVWTETQFGERLMSSVTVGPDGAIWVTGADVVDSRIYRSTNDGTSFTPVGATGHDTGAWWESVEVAALPPREQRVYLAGYNLDATGKTFLLLRSDTSGRSWTTLPVTGFPNSSRSVLQIAAISPDAPSLVFARFTYRNGTAVGDAIYRSTDSGVTWKSVLELDDAAPGVVVRKLVGDGDPAKIAEVFVGTRTSGTYRSTDGGETFQPVARSLQIACLAERPEDRKLFACASNLAPDNMALAGSSDGLDWSPELQFRNVTGPAVCAAGTVQRDACQDRYWCGFKQQLSIVSEVIECPAVVADAGIEPDAGTGGGGGGGCCNAGAGRDAGAAAVLLALGLVWRWRRGAGRAPRI